MIGHRMLRNFLIAVFTGAVFVATAANAATVQVINNDGAGEGFNDPTARAAVGGNSGTTIGQQRLIAFQFAANLWGARLTSNVTIKVSAQFDPQTCSANSTILGSAGPYTFFRDFPNAPIGSTYYASALADALAGSDLGNPNPDITATFNSAVGTTCPFPKVWYYGLDSNPGANEIDFVTVLIHELGHGLGFLTLVDLTTGQKANGFNDVFMLNLENHGASPPDYPSMTNAQRVAASTATGNLHWTGANARAAGSVLTAGRVGDHIQMFAPNTQQPGSSVSHWDTALTPNQIMEPSYTQPLHDPRLEVAAFKDIGWIANNVATGPRTAHDYNGDMKSDIFWRNSVGDLQMWLMNGSSVISSTSLGNITTNWSAVGQRDFSGDSKTDILWRNTAGDTAIWTMNGAAVSSVTSLGNVAQNWFVAGTGDFNGDGFGDIFWRNTTGDIAIWLMNGATVSSVVSLGNIATNWFVGDIADFNGDGNRDILWRNTTGDTAIWFMNGASISSVASLGNISTNWLVAGTSDFDGDGKGDILWRNTAGDNAIWFMNGASILSVASLGNVPTNWSVTSEGDYNGDGKGDILWRSGAGDNAIWFMNGASVSSVVSLGNIPLNWTIQNAGAN